jgi:hypothetical protein
MFPEEDPIPPYKIAETQDTVRYTCRLAHRASQLTLEAVPSIDTAAEVGAGVVTDIASDWQLLTTRGGTSKSRCLIDNCKIGNKRRRSKSAADYLSLDLSALPESESNGSQRMQPWWSAKSRSDID